MRESYNFLQLIDKDLPNLLGFEICHLQWETEKGTMNLGQNRRAITREGNRDLWKRNLANDERRRTNENGDCRTGMARNFSQTKASGLTQLLVKSIASVRY
jgi:hypothetical protein